MMETGILLWPAAFPDQKALEISNNSFGDTGSKNTDCMGKKSILQRASDSKKKNI